MASLSNLTKGHLRGTTPLSAFLAATLGLSAWLGYQAWDAAASHRRTAEAALTDYAGIAAWEFSRAVRGDLDHLLEDIFRPVYRRLRGRLPSPEVVGWEMEDAVREQGCRCAAFREPLALFRVEESPRRIEVVPDTVPTLTVGRLADRIHERDSGDDRVDRGLITDTGAEFWGRPVAVGYMISHDTIGGIEAVFGFVVPADALEGLFAAWYGDRQLLPQPIADGQPNDSLLYVRVRDPDGLTLFASPSESPESWTAAEGLRSDHGDLTVEAAVRPEAASQLIIGGLPQSRLPLLAVLLLLTLGVGSAAFVLLRRELRFQRLRDDFVSGVSHELRTPLAQIRMFAELQQAGKLESEDDRRRAISVIHRESTRLSHLVENILQFSRLRRRPGQGGPTEQLDVAEALAEGVDAATPLLEDREMKLDFVAESGLKVFANRDALTRIIVNLLDNAVKYGTHGQTVSVGVARENGAVRLSVSDEGPGVPASERLRIWKAYSRLERDMKALVPGSGIGLSVVSELTSQQSGRAWVEDAANGGARFVVELPLASDENGPGATTIEGEG